MENDMTLWNALRLAYYLTHKGRAARMMELLHEGARQHNSSIEDRVFVDRVEKITQV